MKKLAVHSVKLDQKKNAYRSNVVNNNNIFLAKGQSLASIYHLFKAMLATFVEQTLHKVIAK